MYVHMHVYMRGCALSTNASRSQELPFLLIALFFVRFAHLFDPSSQFDLHIQASSLHTLNFLNAGCM